MFREGDPALEIVNAAKDGGFDVIVVGHRGVGKMTEFVLGSISENVAFSTLPSNNSKINQKFLI